MNHEIPSGNGTTALANAIKECEAGDTITVHSNAMKQLGERARLRMCPEKKIEFIVKALPDPFRRKY